MAFASGCVSTCLFMKDLKVVLYKQISHILHSCTLLVTDSMKVGCFCNMCSFKVSLVLNNASAHASQDSISVLFGRNTIDIDEFFL
nr:unnamed protein product [Callosobruchus analis]